MAGQPSVIVLAAGKGSRFDGAGHKLAQPLGNSSVLMATLAAAIASHLRVVVVTTAPFAEVARASVAARDVVVLPEVGAPGESGLGMGASIAAGVAACPDARGWLVLPGDMPLVEPATLVAVAQALDIHPIAYAQHNGRRGHPVGFAAELYSELTALLRRRGCAAPGRALSGIRGRARRSGHPDRHRHHDPRSRSGAGREVAALADMRRAASARG
jgi:molybdenum cofactor cytidylyltransferase